MKKINSTFCILLITAMCFGQANHVVISQVYGGGGNAGAVYQNDFVELFNPTTGAVSLDNWSLQYCSATGSSWSMTLLNGIILPGHYFLIQENSAGPNGAVLPIPDIIDNINISATDGKIILSDDTILFNHSCPLYLSPVLGIVDMVGYGSANCFKGMSASSPSNTKSISRNNAGCTYNDTNSNDFSLTIPLARNSQSDATDCNTVNIADLKANVISIYPNPCDGILTISNYTGPAQIRNLYGDLVINSSDVTIDISALPASMYIVSINNRTERIVKIKP